MDFGRISGTFGDEQALMATVSGKVATRAPQQGASNTISALTCPSGISPSNWGPTLICDLLCVAQRRMGYSRYGSNQGLQAIQRVFFWGVF
jgi:hypothetical protein